VRESPAKMYTADLVELLQLERETPIYGPHWAIAKIAAFSAHQTCDYFTNFSVLGCEEATKEWVRKMRNFLDESNHDIKGNRIAMTKDPATGEMMKAFFHAYDVTVDAMARKKTLAEARTAIVAAMKLILRVSRDPKHAIDYANAEFALLKGSKSYLQREDGAFLRNLQGTELESLGLNAAVCAFGIGSLEHALNCHICNAFGSRVVAQNLLVRHHKNKMIEAAVLSVL